MVFFGALGVLGALGGAGALAGLRMNLTDSLPRGIYRTIGGTLHRGSIVMACAPLDAARLARARGYLGPGSCPGGVRALGKLVLAMAGDTVALKPQGIRLNGAPVPNSRTLAADSRGRPLPHYPWGEHVLRPNELWLFAPYRANSYDSRYFGPERASQVVSALRPVWTW